MKNYETDIFKIENLAALSANYVLFRITGLTDIDDDLDNNVQYIIKTLSYKLKHPVTVVMHQDSPFLVVRDEQEVLDRVPAQYSVKRDDIVFFERIDKSISLDFVNYTDETKGIIMRFLQFDIQTQLNQNSDLWQPSSGDAFFTQNPFEKQGKVSIYNGFFVRVVELPTGGFGFSIDVTKKYIASQPLDVHITRSEFQRLGRSKSHFVYQYGKRKYEIRPELYSDLNAGQYKFTRESDGKIVSLIQDTREKFGTSMPPEVAKLPDDSAVIIYKTNDNQERRIIAGLCYEVFDTENPLIKKLHRKSILDPFYRRRFIRAVNQRYLQKNIKFGDIELEISKTPISVPKVKFLAPDILLGNGVCLSVRGSEGAVATRPDDLGRARKQLLTDKNVGFYTRATFEAQYFVIPETIYNMFGNKEYFLGSLISQVNQMHPTDDGWEPTIITYDNRNKRNVVELGFEILQKIKEEVGFKNGGYAVIMLPSGVERIKRQHDDLAALVVSECMNEHRITASIMHSETLERCYDYKKVNGETSYSVKSELLSRFNGYIAGVAINQVLLNNERWPYVLETPLHADLTIGIDVKKQIAGFTFTDKLSKNILTVFNKSNNKEKLSTSQIVKVLVETITIQSRNANYEIERIVVHRDGRLFKCEKAGIEKAISILQEKGILPSNCQLNIIEIPKHSIIPFRLFDVLREFDISSVKNDNKMVLNPEIGSYVILNKREAFLCTTGREFRHQGSSNPLYVKYTQGTMPFKDVLEDLYYLSCLAFTKPDDCSRFPITIKITDRRINTLGSEFDFESLEILKSENF